MSLPLFAGLIRYHLFFCASVAGNFGGSFLLFMRHHSYISEGRVKESVILKDQGEKTRLSVELETALAGLCTTHYPRNTLAWNANRQCSCHSMPFSFQCYMPKPYKSPVDDIGRKRKKTWPNPMTPKAAPRTEIEMQSSFIWSHPRRPWVLHASPPASPACAHEPPWS